MTFAAAAHVPQDPAETTSGRKRRRQHGPTPGCGPAPGPGRGRGGRCRPDHHGVPGPGGRCPRGAGRRERRRNPADRADPRQHRRAELPQRPPACRREARRQGNQRCGRPQGQTGGIAAGDRQRRHRSAGQSAGCRQSRRRHRPDRLQPRARRDRRPVQRQSGHDLPREHRQRTQQLREQRLLFPHLGGRHRPGPRSRQARQGRRRGDHCGCVRGRHLRQRRVQRGGRRGKESGLGPVAVAGFTPGQAQQAAAAAKAAAPDAVVLVSRDRRPGRHRRTEQRRPCRQEAHPQRRGGQPVRFRPGLPGPRRCAGDPAGDLCLRRTSRASWSPWIRS